MPATVVTLDARGEPPFDAVGQQLANVMYLAVRDCPPAIENMKASAAIGVEMKATKSGVVEMRQLLPGTRLNAAAEACLRERVAAQKSPPLDETLDYRTYIAVSEAGK